MSLSSLAATNVIPISPEPTNATAGQGVSQTTQNVQKNTVAQGSTRIFTMSGVMTIVAGLALAWVYGNVGKWMKSEK